MVSCYYSQAASPLGPVYLAATPQGLVYCSTPGGSRGAMLEWLHRQLPGVPCQSGSQPHLGQAQEQLQDYFSGQRRELNVQLQLIGTPFQQSVWQA